MEAYFVGLPREWKYNLAGLPQEPIFVLPYNIHAALETVWCLESETKGSTFPDLGLLNKPLYHGHIASQVEGGSKYVMSLI